MGLSEGKVPPTLWFVLILQTERKLERIFLKRSFQCIPVFCAFLEYLTLTRDRSGREQKREGKRVIAILKEKNKQEMRLGPFGKCRSQLGYTLMFFGKRVNHDI